MWVLVWVYFGLVEKQKSRKQQRSRTVEKQRSKRQRSRETNQKSKPKKSMETEIPPKHERTRKTNNLKKKRIKGSLPL